MDSKKKSNLNKFLILASAIFLLTGAALRLAGLPFVSNDMEAFLLKWYKTLDFQGFSALRKGFSNYTPPYLYLLWLATWTRSIFSPLVAIKLISIVFDIGNVFWVYKIIKLIRRETVIAILGASIFFALPAPALNGSWWGQCDAIYTFFVLGCFYFLLHDRPFIALAIFGVAFSFKFQAVFITPFLFLLLLKRRIPWIYLLIVPVVYTVMVLPAVWVGRPFLEAMTIYLRQAEHNRLLTLNAPNLYQLIPLRLYTPVLYAGLGFSALMALIWAIGYARKIKTLNVEIMIMCAAASTIMMPFFLPKMHDRYYYVADIMLLFLAFARPRLWFVPLASQLVSVISYSIYLSLSSERWRPVIESPTPIPMLYAVIINTALVGFLLWAQYRLVNVSQSEIPASQS